MKVAIFSDVHGNLTALEAVLKDIEQQKPDLTIFAGDLCTDGARPSACLERVQAADIAAIYGNTDERINNEPIISRDTKAAEKRRAQNAAEDNDLWTWSQLTQEGRAWLWGLPFYRRVSPTIRPQDDIFVVHANPLDTHQHIFPSEAEQRALFGEVHQPDDDVTLKKMLRNFSQGTIAFGHLHVPAVREWNNITLVNVASVSLPLDGDQRAKYGLFTWEREQGKWSIEHRRVRYNVAQEVEALQTIQPPNWETLVERLQTATA